DYLVKPFDLSQLVGVVERALAARAATVQPSDPVATEREAAWLVGHSPAMQQVYKQIALAAGTAAPVLITGESGTGKELVARAIHRHSARGSRPFVPVCIPALNPGLVEAELFGHARGAFTGADSERVGLLAQASGGTVFLDEVADIPAPLQVKLLRVLEQGELYPVGSSQLRQIDVRIVSATNRVLEHELREGRFREDLFYRLGAFRIHLAPLRERVEDIPALVGHLLRRATPAGQAPPRPTARALAALQARPWPGNVRELRHTVERAAAIARLGVLDEEHFGQLGPGELGNASGNPGTRPGASGGAAASEAELAERVREVVEAWAHAVEMSGEGTLTPALYERMLALVEPPLLQVALERAGQNRAAAAALLGLHRGTLRQKLRDHGIESGSGRGVGDD
ncbi:MAG: sigma 54-interacting transcriptional regulator, partial [Planctomycetaceae bacterium]